MLVVGAGEDEYDELLSTRCEKDAIGSFFTIESCGARVASCLRRLKRDVSKAPNASANAKTEGNEEVSHALGRQEGGEGRGTRGGVGVDRRRARELTYQEARSLRARDHPV